jgi:hypothetical protein
MTKTASSILIALSVGIFGCSTTNTTIRSFTDPAYRSTRFGRVLILAQMPDLEWRGLVESSLVAALRNQGVSAIEGMELIPPTRTLTDVDKMEILRRNHVDSYLVINVGALERQIYVPPTGSPSTPTSGGSSKTGQTQDKRAGTATAGHTEPGPWALFNVKLYDVSNGHMAWLASVNATGSAHSSFAKVILSFSETTATQLSRDGRLK